MNDIESIEGEATLASPTIDHINDLHGQFIEIGRRNSNGLVEQINKARAIGILLIGEKPKRKGEWIEQFASYKGKQRTGSLFKFDYDTGQNYMKVARALPDPVESLPEGVRVLTDVYRGMGALPNPESQEGRRPKLEFLDRASKQVNVALEVIGKWRDKTPVDQWTNRQREALRDQLQPLVELYNELEGAA